MRMGATVVTYWPSMEGRGDYVFSCIIHAWRFQNLLIRVLYSDIQYSKIKISLAMALEAGKTPRSNANPKVQTYT
jgi:hypothetical protein